VKFRTGCSPTLTGVRANRRADRERYDDVLTDLNLILSTCHRLDMNSSKSWSSESNRHFEGIRKGRGDRHA
jgi:hypothetical protein